MLGSDNEKIGDVSDILFDKAGKIEAFIVSVGGFLGMGAKDVAMAPAAFQVVTGDKSKNEDDKLKVAMTKDQLKQAANFEPPDDDRHGRRLAAPGTGCPSSAPVSRVRSVASGVSEVIGPGRQKPAWADTFAGAALFHYQNKNCR